MVWQMRRANVNDLDAIMKIENTVFGNDAWSPENMRAELLSANTYYLVASPIEDPSRIDGYAGLSAPNGAVQADIQTIAVTSAERQHGLGKAMMHALIFEARQRGAREVFLEVRADNPGAQSLYRLLGFTEIAVRKGYYQPDGVDAIVMRLIVPKPRVTLAGTP